MERFQFAYGWITNWTKTQAYILQPTAEITTSKMIFDSIHTRDDGDLSVVVEHEVSLIKNELEFLRAKIDDPKSRANELKDIIDNFVFPKFIKHSPITLLGKIVLQNIISVTNTTG